MVNKTKGNKLMAEYTITSPDGKEHTVNAPDGATEQEVLDFAKASFEKSNEEAASQASMDKTKSIAGTTASAAGGGANLLPTTIGKDFSRFYKGAKSVAPKVLAEVAAAAFSGGAISPGIASSAMSVLQPGSSAAGVGNLVRGGAKLGAKTLGPVGTAYSAYDLYNTATDPNSTATDYILPTVGTAAGIPTAYAMGKPVVNAATSGVKAVAPYAKASGQLANKGLQAGGQLVNKGLQAISPSKAVAEVAEAQLKARGAQISNFARNYALLKSGAKTALRGAKFIPGAGLVAGGGMGLYDAYQGFNADPNADLGENLANAGSSALSGVTFGLLGTDPDEIAQQSSTFPLTGPAKDIKINQQTGQPWTRQELDAYYTQFPE
jgi:hypothetical protein